MKYMFTLQPVSPGIKEKREKLNNTSCLETVEPNHSFTIFQF